MKLSLLFLLYSIGDFAAMLWTGHHNLFTIASFWASLALFYGLSFLFDNIRRARKAQRKLVKEMTKIERTNAKLLGGRK